MTQNKFFRIALVLSSYFFCFNSHSSPYADGGDKLFYNTLHVEAFNDFREEESSVAEVLTVDMETETYKVSLEENKTSLYKNKKGQCVEKKYKSGVSLIIRPIYYGDVYIEAEITIFNKQKMGVNTPKKLACSDEPNIQVSSDQKAITLILDTPHHIELNNRMLTFTLSNKSD
jgi:hypothetical protein